MNTLCAVGWMLAFCLLGWLVGVFSTYERRVSRWSLLWYSVSYTVPTLGLAAGDQVTLPRYANNWFYVQRLICYALALLAGTAAVGIVQS